MTLSINPEHFKPGQFELFFGPMYSGKSEALAYRFKPVIHLPGCSYLFIRPTTDNRPERTCPFDAIFVDDSNPERILKTALDSNIKVVGIDEIEFFSEGIVHVVQELLNSKVNVIAAGLDLDFRGEYFGSMARLISIADHVKKCRQAVCKFQGCGRTATRTQRLINGQPAPYTDNIKSTEGNRPEESYEPRCVDHHIIPGKQSSY
jgi:thymidine kinase